MERESEELLDAIPVANESGDHEGKFPNQNLSLLVFKDGRLICCEGNKYSMNLMKENFSKQ